MRLKAQLPCTTITLLHLGKKLRESKLHPVRNEEWLHSLKAFVMSTFKWHKSLSEPRLDKTVCSECTAVSKPLGMPTPTWPKERKGQVKLKKQQNNTPCSQDSKGFHLQQWAEKPLLGLTKAVKGAPQNHGATWESSFPESKRLTKQCKTLQTLRGSWSYVTTNSIQKMLGQRPKLPGEVPFGKNAKLPKQMKTVQ